MSEVGRLLSEGRRPPSDEDFSVQHQSHVLGQTTGKFDLNQVELEVDRSRHSCPLDKGHGLECFDEAMPCAHGCQCLA